MDVLLAVVGESVKLKWTLGTCESTKTLTRECCFVIGEYTLTCWSPNDPAAWAQEGARLVIQGHNYCSNFIGLKERQKIYISGREFLIASNTHNYFDIHEKLLI